MQRVNAPEQPIQFQRPTYPPIRNDDIKQHTPQVVDPNLDDENYSVADAENPLQLLARASDISDPSLQTYASNSTSNPSHLLSQNGGGIDQDLHAFFGPFRPRLDVDLDDDPIELGLVTAEESEMLFT